MEAKLTVNEIESQLKTEKASHTFFMRKSEQCENTMADLRKKMITAESEATKYKKLLNEIETSFKELESISDENTKKMAYFEEENKMLHSECSKLREQTQ